MTFQASTADVFAALLQAAERAGLQYLSGDKATGTYVFTAGMAVMTFGEKVTARITSRSTGTVLVTVSSDLQFGMRGALSHQGAAADRLANELSGLLPHSR
jgi:hypothetical protein